MQFPKAWDLQDNQRGKLEEKYVVNILPFVLEIERADASDTENTRDRK